MLKNNLPYIFIITLLLSFSVKAQHKTDRDSSSIKDKLDNRLQKAIQEYNLEKALVAADSLLLYAKQANDSLFLAYGYESKATLYKFKRNLPQAKKNIMKSLSIYEVLQQDEPLLNAYCSIAQIFLSSGKPDSSSFYLNKASKLINDSIPLVLKNSFYNSKSMLFSKQGRIDSSLHYTFKRIELIKNDNHYTKGNGYLELAGIFNKVHDYEKSLTYIDKGISELEANQKKLPITIAKALLFKGLVFYRQGKYQSLAPVIEEALTLIEGKNQHDLKARLYLLKAKHLISLDKYSEANNYITDPIFLGPGIGSNTLFDYYFFLLQQTSDTDTLTLKKYLIKLETLEKSISSINKKLAYYKLVSSHLFRVGDYKKAYEAQKQYLQLKEKANNRQQTYTVYDLENKYQLSIKDEQIALQQSDIEKKQTQFKLSLAGGLLILITGLGILVYYKQRQKIRTKEIESLKVQKELVRLEALIGGEEKERKRIAQDLHDGINGDLSVIKYKITSIDAHKFDSKEKTEFDAAISMLDNAISQIRHISHNLTPPMLQNFKLVDTIKQYCMKLEASSNIKIDFQNYGEFPTLNESYEIAIFRIIQEALNNIIKHAKADEALVQINAHEDTIDLIVEDNGIGFDTNQNNHGIGLQNIHSRSEFLNAKLQIDSDSNGTTITININPTQLSND